MTLDLQSLHLESGGHADRSNGLCVMEAVAWFAGEPHSYRPQCSSLVLTEFAIGLNDVLPDDQRQKLVPLIPDLAGTRDGYDNERGLMAVDWILRFYTPAWLTLAGLTEEAHALETMPVVTDWSALADFMPPLEAAGDAARAAAWAAARDAARAAAWDAARDAALAAAWDAALAAARDAARDAARAAAWDALAPTVATLQQSAIELLIRMAAVGKDQP